jgi:hypothetical protein
VHEVSSGGRPPRPSHTAATLGLGLEDGKAVLAAVQRHLVATQVEEHCRDRRRSGHCGAQRPLKDRLVESKSGPAVEKTHVCAAPRVG